KENIAGFIDKFSPMIVLPETFVFAFIKKVYPLFLKIEKQDGKDLFIHVDHDLAIKSMESAIDKKGFETFLRICGSSSDIEQENIYVYKNEKEIKQVLKTVFLNIPFTELLKFVNKKSYSFETMGKTGLKYLCIACALLFIYSTTCLLLPYQKKKELMAEDQILSKKAGDLIEKRDGLDKKLAQLNLFKNLVEEYQSKTTLIQMLLKTVPQGSLIKRLNISGQVVEIEGAAINAPAFIESLGLNKNILDPYFLSPLRKDKKTNMEIFKLNFKYVPLQNREIDG
ncbi:MAG: PilN domain-containing protein, partial [Desulfobacteraceae bacterium]|nr:PilN domain-containing protein [Desulfobacteraceae bacterium]